MTRIELFVTGRCERLGLASALHRVFPTGDFAIHRGETHSFTSRALRPPFGTLPRAEDTLGDMLRSVMRQGKADFAVLVDDLELTNMRCGANVAEYFRTAAHALTANRSQAAQTRLHERCSVHFLVPMLEAYFFRDPNALRAAGASVPTPADVCGAPEDFRTRDAGFLAPADVTGSWKRPFRCAHPKHYLSYLIERASSGDRYREVEQGAAALRALDFRSSLAGPSTYLDAFLEDVADMLNVPAPGSATRSAAPTARRPGRLLRNL